MDVVNEVAGAAEQPLTEFRLRRNVVRQRRSEEPWTS